MIRFIVAADNKLGIAHKKGIPWDLPKEGAYFESQIVKGTILMGLGTYRKLKEPFLGRTNYVATNSRDSLRDKFEIVTDVNNFLDYVKDDVWVIGGAELFNRALDRADEIYITRIDHDFHCTKFFPEFKKDFVLKKRSADQKEEGLVYRFEIWCRKK